MKIIDKIMAFKGYYKECSIEFSNTDAVGVGHYTTGLRLNETFDLGNKVRFEFRNEIINDKFFFVVDYNKKTKSFSRLEIESLIESGDGKYASASDSKHYNSETNTIVNDVEGHLRSIGIQLAITEKEYSKKQIAQAFVILAAQIGISIFAGVFSYKNAYLPAKIAAQSNKVKTAFKVFIGCVAAAFSFVGTLIVGKSLTGISAYVSKKYNERKAAKNAKIAKKTEVSI